MNSTIPVENNRIKHLSTYGLALFFFLTPFEYPLADLIPISPLRIVGLLSMGLAVWDIVMQRTVKLDYRNIYILLWLIYGFITIFWALDIDRFQSYYSIYMNNTLMFLLFSLVSFTQYEITVLKKSLVFGVGALLLYMTFIPGAIVYSTYQHRLTLNAGTDGLDQNYLAALMLIAFGIVLYNFCNKKQKKWHKVLSIIYCVAIAYYVLLTGSRSGLIAVLLIVLLCINSSWKTRLSIGIPVVVLLLFVFPFVTQYIPEDLLDRFSLSALTGHEAESGTRLVIWTRAISSLQGLKWIFGYGVGASQSVVGDIIGMGKDMAVHNHYIASLVEVGIVGLLFIMIPIIKMVKRTIKIDKAVAISFCGILLMAMFLDVLTTKFFWVAMILLCVCSNSKSINKTQGGL